MTDKIEDITWPRGDTKFSHVKISSFRAKAPVVFHWCLYNKCYLFSYPDDDVTVGKFYATYLIQEYFRRFKARQKAQDQANEVQGNSTVALQVSVGD